MRKSSKLLNIIYRILWIVLFSFSANSLIFIKDNMWFLFPSVTAFLAANLLPGFTQKKINSKRLRICNHGAECLLIFLISVILSVGFQIFIISSNDLKFWPAFFSVLVCYTAHFILFWNGIISVFCTSVQLGIKHRILSVIFAWFPIVNFFIVINILLIVFREQKFETEKHYLNLERETKKICKTKYPILLVHGFFFRDNKHINYWGRIPAQLILNGATVFYGEHQSALSVEGSAMELTERIKHIIDSTGCEKVNIIAHSKGGLDCRYAIKHYGCERYVASLTTVNTPHRGCTYADYLLDKIPKEIQEKLSSTYNAAARKLGDEAPDFMAGVQSLTAGNCEKIFKDMEAPKDIFCQSIGSVLKHSTHGQFPLNFSSVFVKHFEGQNDGLVSERSFDFGEKYTLLQAKGKRGISHGDIIDMNRENIPGFDVREFYVRLVADLKNRGL